jgi:hypothetical protein
VSADSNQPDTASRNGPQQQETLHDLFTRVREHPEFVFGTVFEVGDFGDRSVPDDFSPKQAEARIVETGNRLIVEAGGWPDE